MASNPTNPPESSTTTTDPAPTPTPWYAAFPAPTLTAPSMPAARAYTMLSLKISSLLLIDVRRDDYWGGSIRGSLNVPAQSLWFNRGILYELAYKADVTWVVFTCNSSSGRAPRCAAWFLEHVRQTVGDADMQVAVLEGGVKGWVKGGEGYRVLMDGFNRERWKEVLEGIGEQGIEN